MSDDEKLAEAIKALEWVQGFVAPEMQGFESEADRVLFRKVTSVLGMIKEDK